MHALNTLSHSMWPIYPYISFSFLFICLSQLQLFPIYFLCLSFSSLPFLSSLFIFLFLLFLVLLSYLYFFSHFSFVFWFIFLFCSFFSSVIFPFSFWWFLYLIPSSLFLDSNFLFDFLYFLHFFGLSLFLSLTMRLLKRVSRFISKAGPLISFFLCQRSLLSINWNWKWTRRYDFFCQPQCSYR